MSHRFSLYSNFLFFVLATASCSSGKKVTETKSAPKKTAPAAAKKPAPPAKKESTASKAVPVKPQAPARKEPVQVVEIRKGSDDPFFENLFKSNPGKFDKIISDRNSLNIQIIFTEVSRKKNGTIELTDHYFNKEGVSYYYPASAIKLPLALLALQKINELSAKGITRNTTMVIQKAFSGQTDVFNDPNTATGKPTIEQYIKRAMLVNDNDACNRLYEFLGQEYINTELKKKGYGDAEILHRVGINMTEDENRHTNEIRFYDNSNNLLYTQGALYNRQPYSKRNDASGKGYMSGGRVVNSPMDMSKKNRIALEDLHRMLISLQYPDAAKAGTAFNITESDRQFLLNLAGQFPSESQYPFYDNEYDNGYTKYLLFGGEETTMKSVRSYNTSGIAYGQITDAAIIKDSVRNVEFILSATIYCNADGIINDDKYDYSSTGLPFMRDLGKALYDYDLKRKK